MQIFYHYCSVPRRIKPKVMLKFSLPTFWINQNTLKAYELRCLIEEFLAKTNGIRVRLSRSKIFHDSALLCILRCAVTGYSFSAIRTMWFYQLVTRASLINKCVKAEGIFFKREEASRMWMILEFPFIFRFSCGFFPLRLKILFLNLC